MVHANALDKEFYTEARIQMFRKDLTMVKIAENLGISTAYVSDIVRGVRPGGKYRDQIKKILEMEEMPDPTN